MKIVIATAVYYPMLNGVAVFSHNLAVGLAKRGHEVMVLCPSQTGRNYTRTIDGVKTMYLKSVQAKVYPDQIHPVPEKKTIWKLKLPRLMYRYGFRVSVFPQAEIKKALNEFQPDVGGSVCKKAQYTCGDYRAQSARSDNGTSTCTKGDKKASRCGVGGVFCE